jgi:hypothetical protein
MSLKRTTLALCVGMAVSLAASHRGYAQQPVSKDSAETHSAMSRGAPTTDANVKHDSVTNKRAAQPTPPPQKGGPKARGVSPGQLHVDNRTQWVIFIYVDGDRVGSVGRYGDAYGYYDCGPHQLYARAFFDDGSVRTWGPLNASICGEYTWRLWN